ncbi:TKL/TKL-ccin protein kinase [Coprinopsis cinerea okayama7|uniref:TKL/TKL-ccin protein kinase n=1 Tax=Coprinopsis cinerea (strain Okayama-7 / 130 / ATCC MYA-4618 / FGSC 9003) TaxID=240176 RepID=A8NWS9_COPC7|nr:TKL/TKL-ccin protein kinase [Coprinopsis cinerea okayama7\|eukprot:XP_001836976.2 TKL/TKL-ccin protein kinase [Coprinopsis cinerea okayama7\
MKGLNPNLVAAKKAVERELTLIRGRMDKWSRMGKIKSFLSQDDVSREIMECHTAISDCISKFQLQSQIEIFEWQKEHEANTRLDHQELAMGENKQIAEAIQQGLSLNLYQLQKQSSELLPNRNLSSGEVKRIGEFPVAGTATMDIYEGLYLGKEKVSMKAIRAMKADEKSRHRFNREGEIWAKVWQKDRGQYIVPFYGFCQTDGPFPYMVSPWQENGDALTYVKANDHKINYRDFIKRIALGVQVLHTCDPPIVHGDIKSRNILINEEGHPRLTDFGLSQIINDVSGTPFTQSSIVADSFRYFAPEVCQGGGKMSTMSDMYALGMTVLEILTHQQPYRRVKHHTEAVLKAARGIKPDQPREEEVKARGLDDDMWTLLLQCWSLTPEARPSIEEFIARL